MTSIEPSQSDLNTNGIAQQSANSPATTVGQTQAPLLPQSAPQSAPSPSNSSSTSGLTQSLNDQQIRQNIDALKAGGLQDSDVQNYVNNYQSDGNGGYVLKGSQAAAQNTFSPAASTTSGKTSGVLGKVADFIGGSKVAQAAGSLINNATGGNQGVIDARAQSGQIEQNLAKAIIADKTQGKDTTRLENALHALQNTSQASADQEGNLATNGLSNEQVAGSAIKLAGNVAGAAELGGAGEGITGAASGALEGLKTGAISGALAGAGAGIGGSMENNESVGQVALHGVENTALGGVTGGAAGAVLGAGAGALASKGTDSATSDYINKLLTPDMTNKVSAAAIKSGKVAEGTGLTGARDFTGAIPNFNAIKSSVEQVPGISPSNSALQNVNAIHDAIGNTAQDLRNQLSNQEVMPIITQDKWNGYLSGVKNQIAENPLLVGDAEKTSNKVLAKFQTMIPKSGDITAENILNARQGLDTWIKGLKPNAFNPATENAVSIAVKAVRQGANNLLAESAPDVAVKHLLNHQTNLYNAIDMIAPKAAKEGNNTLQQIITKNPIATKVAKYAATAAGGGILAKEVFK